MTIQNNLFTDLRSFDLAAHIRDYGPPHYPTKRNPVGSLNERFWGALAAGYNEILFENRESEFYTYAPPIGIYEPFTQHLLLDQIANDIWTASQNWPGYEPLAQLCNVRHLNGVLAHIKGFVQKEGAFDQHRDYIHLKNGVIDLSSGSPKLIPFDPKLISRNSIPVCYDPKAKCPRFQGELLAPLCSDDRLLLQKLSGMYLSGTNFLQKIVILQGAPESGKSQLAITTRELIGHHNCAELRVAHLDDRFELGRYLGKILLIGSDVAGDFLSHPSAFRLKGLTGGDLLAGERKHSNRLFYMAGIFNVLITCNSRLVVKLECDRGAWARRILIFLYDQRKHLKSIPNFGHWLAQNEGSGILNLWLEGLLMANDEVAKYGTLLLTPTQKGRTDTLLDESEGVRHFVKSHITSDKVKDLTTDEIIEKYAIYCAAPDRGWFINRRQVERELPNIMLEFFHTVANGNIVRNKKRARGYRNVAFVQEDGIQENAEDADYAENLI
jgi:phage/plasmid-associated DNA primase